MTDTARLAQLLRLVAREHDHLVGVATRLFPAQGTPGPAWLQALLETPEGIDRLESFTGKFGRMQDTLMDKLLPEFLRVQGERTGTVLDNLNHAERLGIVKEAGRWIALRRLRNRLVHEYLESLDDMAAALQEARDFLPELGAAYEAIRARSQG